MELAKVVYKILTAGSLGSMILFILGLLLSMLPALNIQENLGQGISVNLGGCEVSGFSLLFLAGTIILVALVMVSSLILGVLGFFCLRA